MTEPTFRPPTNDDLTDLLTLMREFYSQQHMRFDEGAAASAVRGAIRDSSLGRIYLIYSGATEMWGA